MIGPDEYHEPVDDNAFTNVIARWNLKRAAALPVWTSANARRGWSSRDPRGRLRPGQRDLRAVHGFFDLEPIVIAEVAPHRPIAADLHSERSARPGRRCSSRRTC